MSGLSRSKVGGLVAGFVGLLACLAFGLAPGVAGAEPVCETATATFSSIREQQCYKVPAGVNELHVTAIGARGGEAASENGAGGFGAVVSGDLPVSPGETLYVEVGQNGPFVGSETFGGGGAAGVDGGSGGGASDVRTCSIAVCASLATDDTRLLVAGGGGGGGLGQGTGANAGPAGSWMEPRARTAIRTGAEGEGVAAAR